jgi:hypothetical protein
MAETNIRSPEVGSSKTWTSFYDVASTRATPRLYAENPFRLLGLSVLANARELNKRLDHLQLSAELGNPVADWGFAPINSPSTETRRRAAQLLKDPRERLLAELFWFWPENYPADGTDSGMEALRAGSVADAVSFWASKSADESPTALHNLAVYHHLMAIEQELADSPIPEEDKTAWWGAALKYWDALASNDACWSALRQRVAGWADPQVPADTVDRLRRSIRDLLLAINSSLALRYAEAGETDSAARQVALLGDLHADTAAARRALERGVAPVVRRIDVQIAEAKRVSAEPALALTAANQLVAHTLPDIQVVDTLCGRESPIFVETCSVLVGAALDLIVSYQRATADNGRCLPLLCYLRTLRPTPETAKRVEATFDVVFENTWRGTETDAPVVEDSGTAPEPGYAKNYRVLREALIPGVLAMELGGRALRETSHIVAELLRKVARDACDDRDDIEFALHVYQTLLMLPCEEGERLRREEERQQFSRTFFEQKEKELRLEHGPYGLEITRRGLHWEGRTYAFEELSALRFGSATDETGALRPVVAWKAGNDEVELNRDNIFFDPESAPSHFDRIVGALKFFAVPRLVTGLVRAVQDGQNVAFGETVFRPSGAILTSKSLWQREQAVPYDRLAYREENGAAVLSSADHPRLEHRHSLLDTWNAALLGYVVAALATP